jgi:hypothetical protein
VTRYLALSVEQAPSQRLQPWKDENILHFTPSITANSVVAKNAEAAEARAAANILMRAGIGGVTYINQMGRRIPPNQGTPSGKQMALNAALKQLIETKLAHTHELAVGAADHRVRQAFRNLWTPAITGELVSIRRIEDVTIPGGHPHSDARLRARPGAMSDQVVTPSVTRRSPVMHRS